MPLATPKPATPTYVHRGLTLVEIILGLVVGEYVGVRSVRIIPKRFH